MGFFVSYNDRKDRGFLKSLNAPPVKSCGRSFNPMVFVLFGFKRLYLKSRVPDCQSGDPGAIPGSCRFLYAGSLTQSHGLQNRQMRVRILPGMIYPDVAECIRTCLRNKRRKASGCKSFRRDHFCRRASVATGALL